MAKQPILPRDQLYHLQVHPADLRRLGRLLRPRQFGAAQRRATNEAIRHARKRLNQEIREELELQAKPVKDRIKTQTARGSDQVGGAVTMDREPVPLKLYKTSNTRAGVTAKVRKGEARQRLRHVFMVESYGGNIFEREMEGGRRARRGPLDIIYGPTPIGVAVNQPGLLPGVVRTTAEVLRRRIRHQVEYEMDKAARKA